jgi:osmotically-inducible protein OsmY
MNATLEFPTPARGAGPNPVIAEAERRLGRSAYLRGRSVFCRFDSGTLYLHGQLESFHQKQVAQTAVAQLDGVSRVINEIHVRPSKAR